jgi:hypothetical protein
VLVREKLSKLIIEILHHCEGNQTVEVFVPQLITNLATLVQDSTVGVRQGGVDAVLALNQYAMFCVQHTRNSGSAVAEFADGAKLLVKLESDGVRPQVLRTISEGIDSNMAGRAKFRPAVASEKASPAAPAKGAPGKENVARETAAVAKDGRLATTGNLKRTLNAGSKPSEADRAVSEPDAFVNANLVTEQELLSTKAPLSTLSPLRPPTSGADVSCFHPSSYYPILTEGTNAKPIRLYSEKDLAAVFQKINGGIGKVDDWQARMTALSLIQGVMTGDGCEYMPQLVVHFKGIHEHVSLMQ